MSHVEPTEARPGWVRRTLDWFGNSYEDAVMRPDARTIHVGCRDCDWTTTTDAVEAMGPLVEAHMAEAHPAPEPDLADDLPHVLAELATAASRAGSPAQQALVAAVADVLAEHRTWLVAHPNAGQAERTATAQRAVFRAVQAGIDVVRPNAARQARRAALEEAAAYVAAQRSTVEAAEGLRRHADDPQLPARVERYPHVEQAARTTGPLPVVSEPVTVVDIN